MSEDDETLAVYNAKAADYAAMVQNGVLEDAQLRAFIAALPMGSHVLDLGCGPGGASRHIAAAGHSVDATDASTQMVAMANQLEGVTARLATFDDIEGEALYDGIWANFSLLHAQRADMPRHLAALHCALKPGGLFHIGMKTGTGEHRDGIGRFYTFYTEDELYGLLKQAGFTPFKAETGIDKGLAGTMDPWITIAAHG